MAPSCHRVRGRLLMECFLLYLVIYCGGKQTIEEPLLAPLTLWLENLSGLWRQLLVSKDYLLMVAAGSLCNLSSERLSLTPGECCTQQRRSHLYQGAPAGEHGGNAPHLNRHEKKQTTSVKWTELTPITWDTSWRRSVSRYHSIFFISKSPPLVFLGFLNLKTFWP